MVSYMGVGVVSDLTTPTINIYEIFDNEGLVIGLTLPEVRAKGKGLMINLKSTDESLLVENGIATVSLPTLLSIAGGCSYKAEEINDLFQKTVGIDFNHIFMGENEIDFSILFNSERFWRKIAGLVQESMDIVQENGLMKFLLLEIKVTPILHHMFDGGYPLDVQGVKQECQKLQEFLVEVNEKIKITQGDLAELYYLRSKIEDKMRRIPYGCFNTKKKIITIFCNFRSIGSDTFRITTNRVNIQGMPKVIRNSLLPRHGDVLVEYDLVGSQLIILACLSGEESLIRLYANGEDLYLYIVSIMTGKEMCSVTKSDRKVYKKSILQMLYGAGIETIKTELTANGIIVSYGDVENMRKQFYQSFPAIKKYSDRIKRTDCVTLPDGRKWNLRNTVEPFKVLAHILQYVESVVLRETLVLLNRKIRNKKIWFYLSIHDSVILEASSEEYVKLGKIVRQCFSHVAKKYLHGLEQINVKEEIIYNETRKIR